MIELPDHLGASDTEPSGLVADGLSAIDAARLNRLIGYTAVRSSGEILSALLASDRASDPNDPPWNRCAFDHCALMVFPVSVAALHRHLAALGLRVGATMPSIVVQQRFCARYGLDPRSYRINILRAHGQSGGHGLEQRFEIFYSADSATTTGSSIVARQVRRARYDERRHNRETHFAFTVRDFDSSGYSVLRRRLVRAAGLVPDGGGFNPHDRIHGAGCSTFYFAGPGRVGGARWPRRLELICGGRHDTALAAHHALGG
ncbi:hypothetical protein [Nocardia sp. NPDC052112]|uniref:hypothetical protein n=1 Tax=Nocardia sp. NPDC052112 TaxID=3155646 RepID=UPI00342E3193